ncbi:MAG TPA: hypothetical protein VF637_12815 [Sphingomicrobium sp.]|jgi:hypothetical protein
MIRWLEQRIADHRVRSAQAELARMVDRLANSREIRTYRANRAAGKLGHARKTGAA